MPINNYKEQTVLQKGFSMIEVLIAVLILAIGLLATAAMQMMSMQNTSNSEFRSQAVNMAMDMADRMQTNYIQVVKDAATTPYDPTTNRCGGDAACLSAQSEYINYADLDDVTTWVGQVRAALPGGNAIVCRDSDHDLANDFDSDNDGAITNADDPCTAAANVCDVAGTANNFAPYVIRVCWTESGGRRDMDGDGDIEDDDREVSAANPTSPVLNQIIQDSRVLHQFSITVQ